MAGGSRQGERSTAEELEGLRLEVASLRARLVAVEHALGLSTLAAAAEPPPDPGPRADGAAAHGSFQLVAVGSFALGGALLLRTLATSGALPPPLGPLLGLLYCGLLLLVPAAVARARHARLGLIVQICGALLAPLVVLESARRAELPALAAALALGGICVAGAFAARRRASAALAATALLAPLLAAAALGLGPDTAARAFSVALAGGLALWLAADREWGWLRPLILVPAAILLALALLRAPGASYPLATIHGVALATAILIGIVVVNHALRVARLSAFEQAALPAAIVSAIAVAALLSPRLALAGGAAAGAILLVVAARGAARESAFAAAALAFAVGLGGLEPHGCALALAALVLGEVGRRSSRLAVALAHALLVVACAVALWRGGLVSEPAHSWHHAPLGWAILVAALVLQAREQRAPPERRAHVILTAGSLASALGVAYAASATLVERLALPTRTLVMTAVLAAGGVIILALGRRGWRASGTVGVLALTALFGKVLLLDLRTLGGATLVGSIGIVGGAALAASLLLRRRRPA